MQPKRAPLLLTRRIAPLADWWTATPATLRAILAASFFVHAGQFATAYMSVYLGLAYEMRPDHIGLVISIISIGGVVGSYASGRILRRFGPEVAVIASQVVAAIALVGLGLTGSWIVFAAGAFVLCGARALFRPALGLCIAEECEEANRATTFAVFMTVSSTGLGVAAFAGGWLLANALSSILFLEAAVALVGAGYLYFAVRNVHKTEIPVENKVRRASLLGLSLPFLMICVAAAAMELVTSQTTFAAFFLIESLDFSPELLGILIMFIEISFVILSVPLNRALKNFDVRFIAASGALLVGIGQFLVPFSTTLELAILCRVPYIVGLILIYPAFISMITSYAPVAQRAAYVSIFYTMTAVAELAAPLIGGWIYGSFGGLALWQLCGLIGVIVCGGLLVASFLQILRKTSE